MQQYDKSKLMKLSEFLALLPGVKPRKAKSLLDHYQSQLFNQLWPLVSSDVDTANLAVEVTDSVELTFKDFDEIFCEDDFGTIKITPTGAEVVIKLYEQKCFEMNKGKKIESIPTSLISYSQSADELNTQYLLAIEQRKEEKEKYDVLINNPQNIDVSQFEYKLLNDVFIAKFGLKQGVLTLNIGGVEVSKIVNCYSSNSGKHHDSEVTFQWKNDNNATKEITKYSDYKSNRRNDAERNWGLHE